MATMKVKTVTLFGSIDNVACRLDCSFAPDMLTRLLERYPEVQPAAAVDAAIVLLTMQGIEK